jgi:hypothetical protein
MGKADAVRTTNPSSSQAVMRRAWEIFRKTYSYPSIPFRLIGRPCFAWALKEAWWQAREATRVAAIPADVRAKRIAELRVAHQFQDYVDSYPAVLIARAAIDAEISRLTA